MTPETLTQTLVHQLGLTHWVVTKTVDGISDDEALRQAAPDANNLNWVLGHIVASRNGMIQLAGGQEVLPEDVAANYRRHSEPITADNAVDVATLMEVYNRAQEILIEALPALDKKTLATKAPGSPTKNPDESIGSLLSLLVFHESYHCGQLGILRKAIGHDGVI